MSDDSWKSMKCDCEWVWESWNPETKRLDCERCRLAHNAYCEYLDRSMINYTPKSKIIPVTN